MEPLMWLIVLAVFLVIEAITVGLTTIWFAGGALVAAIASGAGAGILVQWILFLVISLVLLIFTRPLAVRYMNKGVPKTNVNSLIGEKAVVIQKINNLEQTGQVRINDIEWMARTSSDEVTIPEQTVVTIEGRNYYFYSTHRTCTLDPGILYPYCATGICNRCRTSWCIQRNMEHRYSFQNTIY